MIIAVDASQTITQSEYRGIGSYTRSIINALKSNDKENTYKILTTKSELTASVDLLFIPYFFPYNLSLPLRFNTNYIITIHDLVPLLFPDKFPPGLRGSLTWQIQQQLLKMAKGIITDSENSKKDIIRLTRIPDKKIFTVYPAIDSQFKKIYDSKILSDVRSKYNLPETFILYVGDSNWNKNIPLLIKAALSIKIPLVLAGKVFTDPQADLSHPWNNSLKEVTQLIKDNKLITPLGFVPTSDLISLYNLTTLYVQPSLAEGFGLPVIEAMACGCATLISDIPVFREIAVDASIYFNPNSQEELSGKINEVIKGKNLKKQYIPKGIARAKFFNDRALVTNLKKVFSYAAK